MHVKYDKYNPELFMLNNFKCERTVLNLPPAAPFIINSAVLKISYLTRANPLFIPALIILP